MNDQQDTFNRRGFLGRVSTGAAAIGLSVLTSPLQAATKQTGAFSKPGDPDDWFNQIKGKHRIVFDNTSTLAIPGFPFAWPRVFLMTNMATGTKEKDCSVVMVIRHEAIAYALNNDLWKKYNIGGLFNINNPATKAPAKKNPFWKPDSGHFKVPGIGPVKIGINELQDSGVLFCVCGVALTVKSAMVAGKMKADPEEIKKEWMAGVLPGIQIVPSGIWAVGRAQEHGCAYCQAG